jgi:hypothetical protein
MQERLTKEFLDASQIRVTQLKKERTLIKWRSQIRLLPILDGSYATRY